MGRPRIYTRCVYIVLAAAFCAFEIKPANLGSVGGGWALAGHTAKRGQGFGVDSAGIEALRTEAIFDLPRLTGSAVNVDSMDWQGQGLRLETLACKGGLPWPGPTAPPEAALGWDDKGVHVLTRVYETTPHEDDDVRHLFRADSIELFLSKGKGSNDRYMLSISPGLDPRYPDPRHCFFPDPVDEGAPDVAQLKCEIRRTVFPGGYCLHVVLPWENLKVSPKNGLTLGFQLYVMDSREPDKEPVTAMWHAAGQSHLDPSAVFRVRLADRPSEPFVACAALQEERQGNLEFHVYGSKSLVGKRFDIAIGDNLFGGILKGSGDQAFDEMEVPRGGSYEVDIGDRPIPICVIPAVTEEAIITGIACSFSPCYFTGSQFPPVKFQGPGEYHVSGVTFYDQNYLRVTTADSVGRYGAIVEITRVDGTKSLRMRTVCRVPSKLEKWGFDMGKPDALARLARTVPKALPVNGVNYDAAWLRQGGAEADPRTAALLAYMVENPTKAGAQDGLDTPDLEDRQWWVGLKRKLNGFERRYPDPIECPQIVLGLASPVIRVGTAQEAGMKADVVDKLDQICKYGVTQTTEPAAICIAHNGVVFFQRVYGRKGPRSMNMDDRCDIHSESKVISGASMMMLVDQGLVDIDGSIDNYLTPFRDITVRTPMTIRHLYTHMNGLQDGDWGDAAPDTEDVVASFYPSVRVGTYSYNRLGYALGAKVIEAISGESYPAFCVNHLLKPLGMNNTLVRESGYGDQSDAMDLTRFAQMLANRGSYGNLQFFRPETFAQMLPVRNDWGPHGGIGLMWCFNGLVGHTAGNSEMLWFDPDRNLVFVLTNAGKTKAFYTAAENDMVATVMEGINDSK